MPMPLQSWKGFYYEYNTFEILFTNIVVIQPTTEYPVVMIREILHTHKEDTIVRSFMVQLFLRIVVVVSLGVSVEIDWEQIHTRSVGVHRLSSSHQAPLHSFIPQGLRSFTSFSPEASTTPSTEYAWAYFIYLKSTIKTKLNGKGQSNRKNPRAVIFFGASSDKASSHRPCLIQVQLQARP